MYWELGVIGLATIGTNGEVEEEIMAEAWDGIEERILTIAVIATVNGLREINLV